MHGICDLYIPIFLEKLEKIGIRINENSETLLNFTYIVQASITLHI